jgi:ketopantoate reductase
VILVIGAGAVGSFIGATLAGGGCDVTVLGRRASSPDGVRSASGSTKVTVAGRDGDPSRRGRASRLGRRTRDAPELIITAVKMNDLGGAIETAARWPDAPVLAVENGMGADEMLRRPDRPHRGLAHGLGRARSRVVIWLFHLDNIQRLLAGTERTIDQRT